MKLILFPLFILVLVDLLAGMGLVAGTSDYGSTSMKAAGLRQTIYYDSGGHPVCYKNGTCYGEAGTLSYPPIGGGFTYQGHFNIWTNITGSYRLYEATGEEAVDEAEDRAALGFDALSIVGVMGLVTAICVLGSVLGVKILGIGIGDAALSAVIKGSFFITLWTALSFVAFPIIANIPFAGYPIYFGLTVLFGVGTINQIGHPEPT